MASDHVFKDTSYIINHIINHIPVPFVVIVNMKLRTQSTQKLETSTCALYTLVSHVG